MRERLLKTRPANKAVLETIQSASFVVCLDDAKPVTLHERAHQYWHGDGSNRWFDKPCQFIVNDNGTSGFNGEHSMMDGTPTHRLNDTVMTWIFNEKLDFSDPSMRSDIPDPQPLKFQLNGENHADIALLRTPDGHGRIELFRYRHPEAIEAEPVAPNTIGMHRVAFAVDDIDAALEIAARHGCHPLRGVATYEDVYKLTYLRGPSDILVMFAQALQED